MRPWYQSLWFTITMLVLFFPVGLYLMWQHRNWQTRIKWAVTALFALAVLIVGRETNKQESNRRTIPLVPPVVTAPVVAEQPDVNPFANVSKPEPHAQNPAKPAAPKPVEEAGPDNIEVTVMAHEFVKRSLKAPSTASFSSMEEETIKKGKNHEYTVTGWVDSQNSFSAMLRNKFTCTMTYHGKKSWKSYGAVLSEQ